MALSALWTPRRVVQTEKKEEFNAPENHSLFARHFSFWSAD
jgi:hypothetical protein